MFHPMKPETAERRRNEHEKEVKTRTADLIRRLKEKVAADPEGDNGIWADMLREHT